MPNSFQILLQLNPSYCNTVANSGGTVLGVFKFCECQILISQIHDLPKSTYPFGDSFYFQTLKFHESISTQLFTKIAEFKYRILLFVRGKKSFVVFAYYFVTAKIFRRNFSLLCSNLAIIGRIFCNHEYFSGNEGKDL